VPKISEQAKEARREAILAAARQCFSELGYEGATVRRLEEATGLSRGAIFNYFATKEELFLASPPDAERFAAMAGRRLEEVLRACSPRTPPGSASYIRDRAATAHRRAVPRALATRAPTSRQLLEERLRRCSGSASSATTWRVEDALGVQELVADGLADRYRPASRDDGTTDRVARRTPAAAPALAELAPSRGAVPTSGARVDPLAPAPLHVVAVS
jgi:AcrR family transcriptional regulator